MYDKFQTDNTDSQYLLFTNSTTLSELQNRDYTTEINLYAFGAGYAGDQQGLAVFDNQLSSQAEVRSIAMHEIAHSFQIGEVDDNCQDASLITGGEIYSGSFNDSTKEAIAQDPTWSIMKSGTAPIQQPGSYYVFSVEELLSIQYANTPSGPNCDEL